MGRSWGIFRTRPLVYSPMVDDASPGTRVLPSSAVTRRLDYWDDPPAKPGVGEGTGPLDGEGKSRAVVAGQQARRPGQCWLTSSGCECRRVKSQTLMRCSSRRTRGRRGIVIGFSRPSGDSVPDVAAGEGAMTSNPVAAPDMPALSSVESAVIDSAPRTPNVAAAPIHGSRCRRLRSPLCSYGLRPSWCGWPRPRWCSAI
jgi:hypothetical protein